MLLPFQRTTAHYSILEIAPNKGTETEMYRQEEPHQRRILEITPNKGTETRHHKIYHSEIRKF